MGSRAERWLLVLLLFGELVLLSRQASRRGREGPLLAGAAVAVVGPAAHGVTKVEHGFGSIGSNFRMRSTLMADNEALRGEVADLQRRLLRLQTVEGAFLRLGAAMEYAHRTHQPVQVADVVYADYSSWLRSLLLYVGEHGAKVDQPVIDERGLVGRVIAVGGGYAKVQLVTDRTSAVGAMIERTGRQGVIRGDGHSGLQLDYVPLQADVKPGDRVVTAGIDGIYPRGVPIGVVAVVRPG